ncbi:type III restriction enzyme, res subunit [bacterium BMS3Bbin11]|nr:type III restriction enzyme, res subunit [bacterium BMS3Bbin11]
MIQSLTKKENVDNIVTNYGQVIIDECHHLPALSFERLLSEVTARYVVGLTATPQRRDGLHPIMHMQIGPVRFKVSSQKLTEEKGFRNILVTRETKFSLPEQSDDISIQGLYNQLAMNEKRNDLIVNDVLLAIEEGRSPILLTERKDHLEYLHGRLKNFVRHIVVLKGGRSAKERRKVQEQLDAIPPDEERLLLATGRYIGEGFDDARLDTLFLTLPISWKGTLVQYAGRLHRSHPGKKEVRIIDYVDNEVPMLAKMFDKRSRGYRIMGYKCENIGHGE